MKIQALFLISSIFLVVFLTSCDSLPPNITGGEVSNKDVYYVSTTGDNSYTKEEAKHEATPWKTIQKAANSVGPGATVIIAGGTYTGKVAIPETVNGSESKPTIFKNKEGEIPVIDGENDGNIFEGIFEFKNNKYITVKGLKVINFFWFGFNVEASENITIDSCATFNTQASGIYVKTSSSVNITNNNVRKACQRPTRLSNGNGTQEDISIVASDDFLISNNEVWDSSVSGNAGGEGIDAKGGSYDGEISYNYIHDIVPLGLYVDAGSGEAYDIRVFANKLKNTGGIGVAGELGGHAHEIYFYNNLVRESKSSGFVFQETGDGQFTSVYVVNNTFYNNAQSGFAGSVGSYTRNESNSNNLFENNIFYNKVENYRFSLFLNYKAGHVISHNLYFDFKPGYSGEPNNFTEDDLTPADVLEDPQFNNIGSNDFSLKSTSPAIDAGEPITLPTSSELLFTTDINGNDRGNTDWDMGAYEYIP